MEDDNLGKLYQLGDPQLLHIVAFKLADYVPEARDLLLSILKERGLCEADIAEYRGFYLRRTSFDMPCDNCGVVLTLDRPDLESGFFTCPRCGHQSLITYPENWYNTPPEVLGEDVSAEEPPAPEPPDEEQDDSAAAKEFSIDETEGDSLVTCFQCGKELQNDEVFVSRGEFYCEQCFSKQAAASGPTTEHPSDDEENPA